MGESDAEQQEVTGTHQAALALVGQMLAERYRIEALLGTGGMGAVYRAQHIHMKKQVAVKVLHRQMTFQPEVVARFEREAVAAARVEHPNVAAAKDFGRLADGSFYLVLEYVEGVSLAEVIAEGPLSEERALRIARQIAEALFAAHSHDIVHRDLKPENVMLVDRGSDPDFVKVLDFGIAKVPAEEVSEGPVLTKAGTVFGTPEYMAPEQAKGETVDARADLYTLGMILYEMLSGHTAFADNDLIVVLTRQMTAPPPPLPEHVRLELRRVVMRLLEKSPHDRYPGAAELLVDLEALSGASALPQSQTYRRGALSAADLGHRPTMPGDAGDITQANTLPAPAFPLFLQPVQVGTRVFPLWVLLVPVAGLLMGALLAVGVAWLSSSSAGDGNVAEAAEEERAEDPEYWSKLAAKARLGEREALGELRGYAREAGDAKIWRDLGMGYARLKHFDASLQSYMEAVRLDQSLAADPGLLMDVRAAAGEKVHYAKALEFAASALGPRGADLIYDVADAYRADKSRRSMYEAAQTLLDGESLKHNMSDSLRVALELSRAKTCAQYKEIMPLASTHADSRSLRKLTSLSARRGCGFLGISDCWWCLRSNRDLAKAVAAAREKDAYSFAPPEVAPLGSVRGAASAPVKGP